jgi:hypothetical protein
MEQHSCREQRQSAAGGTAQATVPTTMAVRFLSKAKCSHARQKGSLSHRRAAYELLRHSARSKLMTAAQAPAHVATWHAWLQARPKATRFASAFLRFSALESSRRAHLCAPRSNGRAPYLPRLGAPSAQTPRPFSHRRRSAALRSCTAGVRRPCRSVQERRRRRCPVVRRRPALSPWRDTRCSAPT